MADYPPQGSDDLDEAIAEVRREFETGLPERLDTLTSALIDLRNGFQRHLAETFFFTSHSLKGTAGAFEADTLVEPARELSDIARGWLKRGAATDDELADADDELERLRAAVTDYLRS